MVLIKGLFCGDSVEEEFHTGSHPKGSPETFWPWLHLCCYLLLAVTVAGLALLALALEALFFSGGWRVKVCPLILSVFQISNGFLPTNCELSNGFHCTLPLHHYDMPNPM